MRAWWPVIAAIALIGLGYVGELIVEAAFEEGRRNFSQGGAAVLDAVVRVSGTALMLGLGWLVVSGPRQRLAGLVMVLIGGYLSLVPGLSFALLANTDIAMPPLTLEVYQYPVGLLLWIGAAVMVLGLAALTWPTRPNTPIVEEPPGSVDQVEVSPQPR